VPAGELESGRGPGDDGRLAVPLLESSPSLGAPGRRLPWRGAASVTLVFHRNHSGLTRPFELTIGHDQQVLYLAVAAPLDPGSYNTYLSMHLDSSLDHHPTSEDPYNGLIAGVAGPQAWEGYNYYHFDGQHLAEPHRLERAVWATEATTEFRIAIPLDHSNLLPDGRLAACLRAGDDGATAFHYPAAPGAGPRWALLHLEKHWTLLADDHGYGLSRREREVLQALADLGGADAAGERLSLSRRTVERHLENIRHKMRRDSSLACVVEALRYGLIA